MEMSFEKIGNSKKVWAALPLVGALLVATQARGLYLHAERKWFERQWLVHRRSGPNVGPGFGSGNSPSGPGYVGPADPTNALMITSVGGTFSDPNISASPT